MAAVQPGLCEEHWLGGCSHKVAVWLCRRQRMLPLLDGMPRTGLDPSVPRAGAGTRLSSSSMQDRGIYDGRLAPASALIEVYLRPYSAQQCWMSLTPPPPICTDPATCFFRPSAEPACLATNITPAW